MLDDYHVIREPAIHDGVRYLLAHLPVVSHLVIATRSEPPVDVSRLRARGELGEIVSDQLRFSDEEAAALLNDTLELALPAEHLQLLRARRRAGRLGCISRAFRCATGRDATASRISAMTAT